MTIGAAQQFFLGASKATGGGAAGYQIERSLRFSSNDSAYLSKSIANITTFTLSYWMKRCGSGRNDTFVTENSTGFFYYVHTDGSIRVNDNTANRFTSNGLYRDPSAWYHVVINNNGTTFNLYVNNVLDKSVSVNLALYSGTALIGRDRVSSPSSHADFYLADIHFIDGQALTPSSFTEVSATTGQLIPKAYTGTFGTNGFWLKFSDNSAATAAALGNDYSGNSNNWTPNNLSVTAGAGNDSLVDTPTSYGTDTSGVGGVVRGNYCTWNPLFRAVGISTTSIPTFANGNLEATPVAPWGPGAATIGASSGKWYAEFTVQDLPVAGYNHINVGIIPLKSSFSGVVLHQASDGGHFYGTDGRIWNASSSTSGYSTCANGDIVGVAVDFTGSQVSFYKNNALLATVSLNSNVTATGFAFAFDLYPASKVIANFGQRAFAYTAPSGFKALCDTNLGAPVVAKPNTAMDVITRAGGGTTQTFATLRPGLVWEKRRDSTSSHYLFDVNRGNDKHLSSDTTSAEGSTAGAFTFNTNSYTVSSGFDWPGGATVVDWVWDAGTSTVSNTQGSITSTVRANVSAGFSVVTWTGNGVSGATVGHGLGVAPNMIITKDRDATKNWCVYHSSLGATNLILLNATAASVAADNYYNTTPSSTVFYNHAGNPSFGSQQNINGDKYVSYCFAPVVGYSNGFSYTGNGSTDGVFQYLGFRPRLILLKCSSTTGNWTLVDTSREGYNVDNDPLYPNLSNAEGTTDLLDITSNGFKLRTTDASVNSSGATYIGFAWAEAPFAYSRAR